MRGSFLPIVTAHGEGRAEFVSDAAAAACAKSGLVSFRYVNRDRTVATTYPANPGGSPFGITSVTSADGRVTIMMPHPERSTRSVQNSWRPDDAGEWSGWMRLFRKCARVRSVAIAPVVLTARYRSEYLYRSISHIR